jgi:hypothetical protein
VQTDAAARRNQRQESIGMFAEQQESQCEQGFGERATTSIDREKVRMVMGLQLMLNPVRITADM